MKFLSNTLIIQFDHATKSLLICHPNTDEFPYPLVSIREETYSAMSFDEASGFLGARLLLLIPEMRACFQEEIERMASK